MVILGAGNSYFYSVHIKLSNAIPLTQAIALTENSFKKYNPDFPFEHHFADVEYERKFYDEKQTQKLAGLSGSLAILISCLGILGLSIHIANKRVKEVGIRKVFGASIASVLVLLSKEPMKLICISLLVASPFAYWAMQKWLENYDYKISIGWTVFLFAGAGMLVIALVTISIQTIRAALMNPAKTLKHE
jgi:putative ABC transport system permease protein